MLILLFIRNFNFTATSHSSFRHVENYDECLEHGKEKLSEVIASSVISTIFIVIVDDYLYRVELPPQSRKISGSCKIVQIEQ